MTGGAGKRHVLLGALFYAQRQFCFKSDGTTANIDKITDFVGNGAAVGDPIRLGLAQ